MNKLYRLLKKIPVFRGLEQSQIENILCFLEDEKFDMGEDILKEYENEEDTKMYIILEGGVEVLKRAPSQDQEEVHLNILKPGESFGEMGLVDVMVRSATIRAIAPTRVFSLSTWNLNRVFELHPKIYGILMRNIAQQISRRLRRADVFQASVLYKEMSAKKEEKRVEKIEEAEKKESKIEGGLFITQGSKKEPEEFSAPEKTAEQEEAEPREETAEQEESESQEKKDEGE